MPKTMSHHTKKCKYTPKMIEMIFSLYEICSILILLNIVIPYHWNKFVSHVKSLIIISQIGIFGGNDHKYVVINI